MLSYLFGRIKERQLGETTLVVGSDSSGLVGYCIKTPDHPRYESLTTGSLAELYIYTHVREDAFDLFGFISKNEKNVFTTLLSVSGVGPKMALGILSHVDDQRIIEMILDEDKEGLTGISGVGKKTAERMILELKDNIKKRIESGALVSGKGSRSEAATQSGGNAPVSRNNKIYIEAYLALQGLGFKEQQAKQMIERTLKEYTHETRVEEIIKLSLQAGQ